MPACNFILERPMLHWLMVPFANKTQKELLARVANDCKAHCIATALSRQARTIRSITKIAFFQFFQHKRIAFMAGSATIPRPACSQGQPRGMKPDAIFQLLYRHEKRAGQFMFQS